MKVASGQKSAIYISSWIDASDTAAQDFVAAPEGIWYAYTTSFSSLSLDPSFSESCPFEPTLPPRSTIFSALSSNAFFEIFALRHGGMLLSKRTSISSKLLRAVSGYVKKI